MKTITNRQIIWQFKKNQEGLCRICGKRKIFKAGECRFHYKRNRERSALWHINNRERHNAMMRKWAKENRKTIADQSFHSMMGE